MTLGMRYLCRCVNEHIEFRIPELKAIASMYKIPLRWLEPPGEDPYLVLELQSQSDARKLMSRSMLVRSIYELWGTGTSMEDLHNNLKQVNPSFLAPHIKDPTRTFKINVESYNKKLTTTQKLQKIESFIFLPFEGKVKLKDPDCSLHLIEHYGLDVKNVPELPHKLYFGRWIADGQRDLIEKFSLKERIFIGNTSMDAQLSLIMSNLAQISPGDIVCDPFVGTGSTLVAAAYHGAYVWGWDIDYLTLHAQTKPSRCNQKKRQKEESIRSNLKQYNLEEKYLDAVVMDSANSQWREIPFIDAIITDPPYGIRESLSRVGTHKELPDDIDFTQFPAHFPAKISYNVSDIYCDLLNFAAKHLVIGGRLVFWIPITREDYDETKIPVHPCLDLQSNCEQVLNTHSSRRLITLEKLRHPQVGERAASNISTTVDDFRNKFFEAAYSISREERIYKKSFHPRDKRGQSLSHRINVPCSSKQGSKSDTIARDAYSYSPSSSSDQDISAELSETSRSKI